MVNVSMMVGRLTAKPELRKVGDTSVTLVTVALNKTKEEAYFVPVEIWGKQAEAVAQYCDKGSKIAVKGYLKTGKYTNKDGKSVNTFAVCAESVEFCDGKGVKNE